MSTQQLPEVRDGDAARGAAVPGLVSEAQPRAGSGARGLRRRSRTVVLVVFAVLLVAVAAGAVLVARDALIARDALSSAAARLPAMQQIVSADGGPGTPAAPAALAGELAGLQADTAEARSRTDGPLWTIAGWVPQVGPNLTAAATMAAALDDVARSVAPALLDARSAVDGAAIGPDGTLDLTALAAAAPGLAAANATTTEVAARLDALNPAALLPELSGPLVSLRSALAAVAPVVATADRAAALLPPMLGADGPRSYLLLAVTNAELRAGGGIPGALAVVRADHGRVEVVREVPASVVGPFAQPVADLGDEAREIFSDRPTRFVQDVTHTPDFPTAAALAATMWEQSQGEQVDGVLAADPVALAHLLAVTGPVSVPLPVSDDGAATGTVDVTADNAAALLEHDTYLQYSPEQADAFFGEVLAATVSRLTGGGLPASALISALDTAADEHRVQVWSRHDAEQQRIAGTTVSGAFLDAPQSADALGIFLDDAVGGKMSWFLDSSVTLVASQCTPKGRVDTVDVTLTSTAPADAATSLPWYVAGLPGGEQPPGTIAAVLRVAGQQGAPTPRFERDGNTFGLDTHPLAGRSWAAGTITLAPGESTTVRVESLATPSASRGEGAQLPGRLDLWSTPTAHTPGLWTAPVPVCP